MSLDHNWWLRIFNPDGLVSGCASLRGAREKRVGRRLEATDVAQMSQFTLEKRAPRTDPKHTNSSEGLHTRGKFRSRSTKYMEAQGAVVGARPTAQFAFEDRANWPIRSDETFKSDNSSLTSFVQRAVA